MVSKQSSPRADSLDYRTDLLSPAVAGESVNMMTMEPSWQLSIDKFRLPERRMDSHSGFGYFLKTPSELSNDFNVINYMLKTLVAYEFKDFFFLLSGRGTQENFRVLQMAGKASRGIQ
jgi:hypothetical protein